MSTLTAVDFFAGAGGFSLGFERAGIQITAQVEKNEQCLSVLATHFPGVCRYRNVLTYTEDGGGYADVFAFGDPCPKHSQARSNGKSRHPDLSGYSLALVGRFFPEWVVRENVPSPTVAHFAAALEALGYGTVVIRMDSSRTTGQIRHREIIVGQYQASRERVREVFHQFPRCSGNRKKGAGTRFVIPCLTTEWKRYDSCDSYVWHPEEQRLRILDGQERETFAGFPDGWTDGLSDNARARIYGNALDPGHAEKIGRAIMAAGKHNPHGVAV